MIYLVRWFTLLLIFVLQGWFALAQSPTLVVPSAEDYVKHVEEIVEKADNLTYLYFLDVDMAIPAELQALYDEVKWRELDKGNMTYEQVTGIYSIYNNKPNFTSRNFKSQIPLNSIWMPHVLETWLNESPTILSDVSVLQFDDFVVTNRRLGTSENFLLTVIAAPNQQPNDTLLSYVAIQDSSRRYEVPSISKPIEDGIIAQGDFNADGQPDIAYSFYYAYNNSYATGSLWVAEINPNRIDPIADISFRHGPFTSPLTWQAQNIDSDSQIEFVQTQLLHDNWSCDFVQVDYYDWDNQLRLVTNASQDVLPNTFECLWRQAEVEVWNYRFDYAIKLYETAFSKLTADTDSEALALFHLRYAMTLLLAGQEEAANAKFMNDSLFENNELTQVIQQIYLNDPRTLPTCQRYFNYTADNPRPFDNYLSGTVYETNGGFWGPYSYDPGFSSENASCDLSQLLESYVANTTFPITTNPVQQLKTKGLIIGDSLMSDLNGDGLDDWLVWIDSLGVDPLLFVANQNTYTASRLDQIVFSDLLTPNEYNRYNVITLPDGSTGLLNLDFSIDTYATLNCVDCGGGGEPISCPTSDTSLPQYVGKLTLWRIENDTLTNFFRAPMCEFATLQKLFPNGTSGDSLIAGSYASEYSMISLVVSTAYQWDESAKTYLLPARPTPTPNTSSTQIPFQEPVKTYKVFIWDLRELIEAFQNRDFALVLHIADTALESDNQDEELVTAFRYYRALALEATNQPEVALEEYIAIYNIDPSSAWGTMASLHFE